MPSPGPIVDITVITGDSHRERTERGRRGRERQEAQQALHLDIQTFLCTESKARRSIKLMAHSGMRKCVLAVLMLAVTVKLAATLSSCHYVSEMYR